MDTLGLDAAFFCEWGREEIRKWKRRVEEG